MAKLTKQEEAQMLALRGDPDAALAKLTELKSQGDDGASASIAVIAGFRAQWGEVLAHAEAVFASPTCVDTLNVYTETVQLAALAAASLGQWAELQNLAKIALKKLSKVEDNDAHVDAVKRLGKFAARKGEGAPFTLEEPDGSLSHRKTRFDTAMAKLASDSKKRFKTPSDRLDHVYGVASVLAYHDGAVQLFDRERALPDIFDNVAFAAAALVRAGRTDEAWNAVRTKLPLWWPVEAIQIAPVVLLADAALSKLMTAQRCEEVLRSPRGPGAT